MPNPFFSFKQFTVYHDRCAMKVGTDGVLLGAWTDVSNAHRILDIGTGTGLISLMIAQRCPEGKITALDIDSDAVSQAYDNVQSSPWPDRIEVILQDICTYHTDRLFDTIVSNPPYFIQSLKSPDIQRNTARHTDTLDAGRLVGKVASLLSPEGHFSMIIPSEQADEIARIALQEGLHLTRHTAVITRPGLPPKRALLEFRKTETNCRYQELVIELERHVYSDDYQALTKDFYLKM